MRLILAQKNFSEHPSIDVVSNQLKPQQITMITR